MAPRSEIVTQIEPINSVEKKYSETTQKRPAPQIVWKNVYFMAVLHLLALYDIYLLPGANLRTWLVMDLVVSFPWRARCNLWST